MFKYGVYSVYSRESALVSTETKRLKIPYVGTKMDSNENLIESDRLRGASVMNINGGEDSTFLQLLESEMDVMLLVT